MIIPRFTIRAILAVTTVCAALFVVVGMGFRGELWAWGLTIGVLSLAVTALVHAIGFGLVWCFARLSPEKAPATAVTHSPPAQEDAS